MIDYVKVQSIMDDQNWEAIARRTFEMSDDWCPGGCFLSAEGKIEFGETMIEISGLPIAFAYEEDLNFSLLEWFEKNCPAQAETARIAFEIEVERLSRKGIPS